MAEEEEDRLTTVIGILVGVIASGLIVVGFGVFLMFRIGLRAFDRSLKAEVVEQGKAHVELAALKIKNPVVRSFVMRRLVPLGGSVAVSVVRGALQSRMRTGLYTAIVGIIALIGAFFTSKWLPLMWPSTLSQS